MQLKKGMDYTMMIGSSKLFYSLFLELSLEPTISR